MRASAAPVAAPASEASMPQNVRLAGSSTPTSTRAALDPMLPPMSNGTRPAIAATTPTQMSMASASPETAPPPTARPADIHVQIEAPLVFRGSDKAKTATTQTATNMPPANPARQPRTDPTAPVPVQAPPPVPAQANAQPDAKEHHGFFGKVKHFFSGMFH
jgi:hypothetical protein